MLFDAAMSKNSLCMMYREKEIRLYVYELICRCSWDVWQHSRHAHNRKLFLSLQLYYSPTELNFVQHLYPAPTRMITSPRCRQSWANTVGPPRMWGLGFHLKPQAVLTQGTKLHKEAWPSCYVNLSISPSWTLTLYHISSAWTEAVSSC